MNSFTLFVWGGGWVDGWLWEEEEEAVGMRCCPLWMGESVGGWDTHPGERVAGCLRMQSLKCWREGLMRSSRALRASWKRTDPPIALYRGVGGWVGGWVEESEAILMSYGLGNWVGGWVGGWMGGWVGEMQAV